MPAAPFLAITVWHFILGAASVAWARYQQIYMSSVGFSPSYIGVLTAVGLLTKVTSYSLWSFAMDLQGGSSMVLAATVALSAVTLAVFKWAAENPGLSVAFVVLTKTLRSGSNSQYTLLDAVTMASVEQTNGGIKLGSDDEEEGYQKTTDSSQTLLSLEKPSKAQKLSRAAPQRAAYGLARVWGSIGWAIASPCVGFLIDQHGIGVVFTYTYVWSAIFIAMILSQPLCCPGATTASKPKHGDQPTRSFRQNFNDFWVFLSEQETRGFLLLLLEFSFVLTIFDSVFWVHYEQRCPNAPKSIIGWATSLQTVFELPVFFYAGAIKKRFGVSKLLTVARAALVARLALSLLLGGTGEGAAVDAGVLLDGLLGGWAAAYVVLPVQALHGLSFGLYKAASVDEAHRLAPPGLQASAQGAVAVAGVLAGRCARARGSASAFRPPAITRKVHSC